MLSFLLKKLLYGILVILGVVFIIFFIFHALPGDPVTSVTGPRAAPEIKEKVRKELGLDAPLPVQFFRYLNDLSPLSVHEDTEANEKKYSYVLSVSAWGTTAALKAPYLGQSFQRNQPVGKVLSQNIEGTVWLAFSAILLAILGGISLGVFAALNKGSLLDHLAVGLALGGMSIPSFVAATLLAMAFGYYLAEYTGLNLTGQLWVQELEGKRLVLKNLILPAVTLSLQPLAIITQITRTSLLDVLTKDYIRTAKAKGLPNVLIIGKHALRNALNPVVTAISNWFATLLAGAFFVEYVFNWKGLGWVAVQAVYSKDLPVIMGATLVVAVAFVCINIISDLLYALLDPRVRER